MCARARLSFSLSLSLSLSLCLSSQWHLRGSNGLLIARGGGGGESHKRLRHRRACPRDRPSQALLRTSTHVRMYACMSTCTHVYMYACVHVYVCKYMYACVQMRVYTHTHIRTYVHTFIHTHAPAGTLARRTRRCPQTRGSLAPPALQQRIRTRPRASPRSL